MTDVTATSERLLEWALPVHVGSYLVERQRSGGPTYADYDAAHATLGHPVLLRHERWASPDSAHGSLSSDPRMDRATELAALEGLRRSRRLQAELQHPRIVPVVDFFEHEGEWFSVFARTAAQSLHDVITAIQRDARPPYNLAEFVAVSAGVTDGLAAIHQGGFVHRTVGTHNILVDAGGFVRLSDLGCATPVGADDEPARAFRRFMLPAAAAPEQFALDGMFSPAIDNWALGVALFELRYGRHPFWSEQPTRIKQLRRSIVEGVPAFPPAADEAERLLQPWLRRLLARDPDERYHDALEAQRDLHAIASTLEEQRPVATAFVAMPFAGNFDALWRAVWAACAACRVSATRADQSHRHENIWDEITDAIDSSDALIAVTTSDSISGPNPNVMLEIGYARGRRKPVLLLTDNPECLPFDLRTQRALVYEPSSVGGGVLHRSLVSFLTGIVTRSTSDMPTA